MWINSCQRLELYMTSIGRRSGKSALDAASAGLRWHIKHRVLCSSRPGQDLRCHLDMGTTSPGWDYAGFVSGYFSLSHYMNLHEPLFWDDLFQANPSLCFFSFCFSGTLRLSTSFDPCFEPEPSGAKAG